MNATTKIAEKGYMSMQYGWSKLQTESARDMEDSFEDAIRTH